MSNVQVEFNNRIPELKTLFDRIGSSETRQRAMSQAVNLVAPRLLRIFQDAAPVGSVEPNLPIVNKGFAYIIPRGRPSLRLHGMTLAEGWEEPRVAKEPEGAELILSNHAPHMAFFAGDDKRPAFIRPHLIPGRSTLAFHWGSPLRWPPKDGLSDGPRMFKYVNHPGARLPTNWSETAYNTQGRFILYESFTRAVNNTIDIIRKFFNE